MRVPAGSIQRRAERFPGAIVDGLAILAILCLNALRLDSESADPGATAGIAC